MKIAIRMDDITPDMNWENFLKLKEIFDKYNVKPLLGVVPDCQDEMLHCEDAKEDFWEYLKGLQQEGWVLAQHGCYHQYTTKKGGLFPLNCFSEYAGVPYEKQKEQIAHGRNCLLEKGIHADIFMAPGHTYDRNTLKTLREYGFTHVTDGFGKKPYLRDGLVFLPIAEKKSAVFGEEEGYTTLVIHANGMKESEIQWYDEMIGKHTEKFIPYGEYLSVPAEKRGCSGHLTEYWKATAKRLMVKLLSLRNR